jgi:hypothetical protein
MQVVPDETGTAAGQREVVTGCFRDSVTLNNDCTAENTLTKLAAKDEVKKGG